MKKFIYALIVIFLTFSCQEGKKGQSKEQAAASQEESMTEEQQETEETEAPVKEEESETPQGKTSEKAVQPTKKVKPVNPIKKLIKPKKEVPPPENPAKHVNKEKAGAKSVSELITIDKYSKLNLEEAKLLMEKYWYKFKGKDYNQVKDQFEKYKKEANDIFLKYGITDKQELVEWVKDHKKEIRQYWKDYPRYEVHALYPEFEAANEKIHELAQAARNGK